MAENDQQNPETDVNASGGQLESPPPPQETEGAETVTSTEGLPLMDPALTEGREGAPGVTDAVPDDLDGDPKSSLVLPTDSSYKLEVPATMQEQKAPKLVGEAEKRGYYGETAADRAKAAKAEQDQALVVQSNAEAVEAVPSPTENQE